MPTYPGRELLAVFDTPAKAEAAKAQLWRRGIADVRIGDLADQTTALRAEMREELSHSWLTGAAGLNTPKEGAKGLLAFGLVAMAVCVVIAVPFAFIDFGLDFAGRALLLAAAGTMVGLTVTLVIGPALGTTRQDQPAAAQRGVVLRVHDDSAAIRSVLAALGPIRLDEVDEHDEPVDTVITEEAKSPEGIVQETVRNARGDDTAGSAGD